MEDINFLENSMANMTAGSDLDLLTSALSSVDLSNHRCILQKAILCKNNTPEFIYKTKQRYLLYLQEIDNWDECKLIHKNIITFIKDYTTFDFDTLFFLEKRIDTDLINFIDSL